MRKTLKGGRIPIVKADSKYQWPASALTPADMKLLHAVREARPETPITELIARAVRQEYGRLESATSHPQEEISC